MVTLIVRATLFATLLSTLALRAVLPGNYALVWADEFKGTALDTSKWSYSNGARRDATNTSDAVAVADDVLTIRTYTEGGKHYTSFLATWNGNIKATYGYWEARIRFTGQKGMWSAFWLQSDTINNTGNNPAVNGAEIDVVEHRRYNSGGTDIRNLVSTNLHWDGYGADHKSVGHDYSTGASVDGQWHKYGVLWTASGYSFFFDDEAAYWTTSSALSKRSEYIILSSEVDNSAWAGPVPSGGYGARGASTNPRMEVDWVRVWQPNQAPAFTSTAALNGTRARLPYVGTLASQASDPNGSYDELTFAKTSGPGWLQVAPDGTLGGTPPPGAVGTNNFTFRVTDTGNPYATTAPLFDDATLSLTVVDEPEFVDWSLPSAPPPATVVRFSFETSERDGTPGGLSPDPASGLAPGIRGSALKCAASGAGLTPGGSNPFPGGTDPALAVSLWVFPDSLTGRQTLVDKGDAPTLTRGYRLELNENQLIWAVGGGAKTATATAVLPLLARTWLRVDAVWDPALDTAQLYVDGVLAGSAKVGGLAALDSSNPLRFGSRTDLTNPFTGLLDEFSLGTTPRRPLAPGELVRSGAKWRFYDGSAALPATWKTIEFDDAGWAVGTSPLGFGDDDLSSTVDPTPSRITTYFRHTFVLPAQPAWPALSLKLVRDDGAVVYLNGAEVFRSNLPAGTITGSTLATTGISGAAERVWQTATIPGLLLRPGANVVAVEVHQNSNASSDLALDLALSGNEPVSATLAAAGGVWKYRDGGFAPSSTWRTAAYDDAAWLSGPAPLGYGGAEATTVGYGADAAAKYPATWFRRTFTVPDPTLHGTLNLRLLCDDGALVYLNGAEVARENLPAGTLAAGTYAVTAIGGTAEQTWLNYRIPAAQLVQGANILAVEVRQSAGNSSDLMFDLSLAAEPESQPRVALVPEASGLRLRWPSHWLSSRVWWAEDLKAGAIWTPLGTTPTQISGWSEQTDPETVGSTRFYRLGP